MSSGTVRQQRAQTELESQPRFAPIIDIGRRRRVRQLRLWTIDYYIVRSFLVSYIVCALSFTGLYIAVEAFTKLHRFIPAGQLSPLEIVGHLLRNLVDYHMAMVPTIYVNYMGPILTLAAAMFSLTFMNRGNEFTPIKAAGVSLYRVLLPIFLLAAGFTALTFYLQEKVIPVMRQPIRRALAVSRSGALRPEVFYDTEYNLHIDVKGYYPSSRVAAGVTIKRWNLGPDAKTHEENAVIDAEKMIWKEAEDSTPLQERGRWMLRDGSTQSWRARWRGELIYKSRGRGEGEDAVKLKEPFQEMEFETSLMPIDLETSDQDISYLSWPELKRQFERQPYHRHLRARLHHHFAFPLSHVILLLLGIPFVLNYQTRSFFLSLVVAFFLCAGYFLLSSMALSLASDPGDTYLSPILASWLPNILFGSLGLTIFTHMRT